jgi:hypothetical protein
VTQGVKLVKLDEGASISSITRVISEEGKTDEEPKDNQLSFEDVGTNDKDA